ISDPMKEHREMMAKISDPMKEHREMMAKISDPMKEHHEMMAKISDPMKEHREMMAKISDPMKEYYEMMAKISDPMKEHREMMAKISDPMKEHREMMVKISDPMKEHREMMAKISDPMKEHREMMAKISDPMKEYREMMAKISDPMKEHREMMANISSPLKNIENLFTNNLSFELIKSVALEVQDSLKVDSYGEVSLSSKRIVATELQSLSDQIIHNASLNESNSLEESINNLINEIRLQRDPWTQKLLMWFICPLIIIICASVINPIVDNKIKPYLKGDKRTIVKELKSTVNSTIDNKNVLSSLRYVSASILNVRSSASSKSEVIGYLYFSSSILIIEKQKNWTLVEWNDPDTDVKVTGWVFSRYLKKFR
ncbi:hypothetical protein A9Q81_28140, partial [Gammaproteobacteria bacterium 42_54_T18]